MSRSRDHYPKALVPQHITPTYVRNLEVDTPAYLEADSTSDDFYIRPNVFVTPDRELRLRLSAEITQEDREPYSPLGRVGIMRVVLMDGESLSLRQGIVADLRYVNDTLDETIDEAPDDQEELNEWLDARADSVAVDAFIANDRDAYNGAYYGAPEFYPSLDALRKRGSSIFRSYKQQERARAKQKRAEEAAKQTQTTDKSKVVSQD